MLADEHGHTGFGGCRDPCAGCKAAVPFDGSDWHRGETGCIETCIGCKNGVSLAVTPAHAYTGGGCGTKCQACVDGVPLSEDYAHRFIQYGCMSRCWGCTTGLPIHKKEHHSGLGACMATCEACRLDSPGQGDHQYPGGCMHNEDEDDDLTPASCPPTVKVESMHKSVALCDMCDAVSVARDGDLCIGCQSVLSLVKLGKDASPPPPPPPDRITSEISIRVERLATAYTLLKRPLNVRSRTTWGAIIERVLRMCSERLEFDVSPCVRVSVGGNVTLVRPGDERSLSESRLSDGDTVVVTVVEEPQFW